MNNCVNPPGYVRFKLSNVISISQIVTIHYFEFDKNFYYQGEAHNFWEMVYVDSGEILITAGKKQHLLKQDQAIFHKPNMFHSIESNKKSTANIFIISFVANSKSMAYFKNGTTQIPHNLKHYIKTIIEEGVQTFELPLNNTELKELLITKSPPFGGQQMIKTALEQLLIMIIRQEQKKDEKTFNIASDKENTNNHLVNLIIELLEKNIYTKITVKEICEELCYSKAYISKIFNKNCNCSIIDYYSKIKIKESKKLIRENLYSFSEISNMLCFDNAHYFSRVFKRVTNMSPREYKNCVKCK